MALMEYIDYFFFPNIKQVDLYDKDELCHPVMVNTKISSNLNTLYISSETGLTGQTERK